MRGQLRAARRAIIFFFCSTGSVYGLLTARLPALREHLQAGEALIGMAMLSLGCGSLVGFAAMHVLQRYWSTRDILRMGSVCLLLALPLCGLAPNGVLFCAACGLLGGCFALADVAMNTQGILLEQRLRHNCLSGLHACYSFGGLGGSLLGALFAAAGAGPLVTFMTVAGVQIVCWRLFAPRLLPDRKQPATDGQETSPRHGIPPFIYLCGFLALAAYAVEGSCAEWSALLLHTVKGASESTAALGFGAFSVAIALSRLLGDGLRQRWGDFALLLASTSAAFCGLAIVLLSPWPALCLAGYALTGAGMAPIMPVLLSRAGSRDDISPQRATTTMATLGYAGLLVIPPGIGWLAQWYGLPTALLLPLLLSLLLMASSLLFRRPARQPRPRG